MHRGNLEEEEEMLVSKEEEEAMEEFVISVEGQITPWRLVIRSMAFLLIGVEEEVILRAQVLLLQTW